MLNKGTVDEFLNTHKSIIDDGLVGNALEVRVIDKDLRGRKVNREGEIKEKRHTRSAVPTLRVTMMGGLPFTSSVSLTMVEAKEGRCLMALIC